MTDGRLRKSLGPRQCISDARISDADMELIVDRVLARLGSGVRGAVIDLAERLVKAEIDRLKALR